MRGAEVPDYGCGVDEGVDFEVHCEAEKDAGEFDVSVHHCPEESYHNDAQQTLGTAARADRSDHRVQQPDTSKFQCPISGHATPSRRAQHQHNKPSGNDVGQREDKFAEREPGSTAPCGW